MQQFAVILLIFCSIINLIWACHQPGHHRRHGGGRDYWCEDLQPEVTVFKPKGVRIVVECNRGIKDIEIRGKFGHTEIKTSFSREFLGRRKRKWIFQDDNIWLVVGDLINFELFATNRWDSIHTIYRGDLEVKELVDRSCKTCSNTSSIPTKQEFGPKTPEDSVAPSTASNSLQDNLRMCQQTVRNVTEGLVNLQADISQLSKRNQLLLRAFENSIDAKKLTLSGVIPHDGSAKDVVSFILWEKLDLKPRIVSAIRGNDSSITFEVETLDEKLEILEEAEENLKNTRIKIA